MELWNSEVLGRCLEERAEGLFSSAKSKASAAQTANDYARLSIPLSTRFRSLKKWTWGEPGVGSVHRGVHLAAQDVSVLAAAIRSEPWGWKHLTDAAVVVPGSLCLHLYFIKTDFMTGIFFFFFVCVALSDFMGWFTLPPSHMVSHFETASPTPRKFLQEIIVWGTNFGGKPWKSYQGPPFFAIASGYKYLNKSSPSLPSNAWVAWTKLIFISPLRMLAPPRKKTKIGAKRCFQLSLFIQKLGTPFHMCL